MERGYLSNFIESCICSKREFGSRTIIADSRGDYSHWYTKFWILVPVLSKRQNRMVRLKSVQIKEIVSFKLTQINKIVWVCFSINQYLFDWICDFTRYKYIPKLKSIQLYGYLNWILSDIYFTFLIVITSKPPMTRRAWMLNWRKRAATSGYFPSGRVRLVPKKAPPCPTHPVTSDQPSGCIYINQFRKIEFKKK